MAIPFACPFCGQETLVEDEYAGQSGPCATCGKKITVPFIPGGQSLAPDEIVTGVPYRSGPSLQLTALVVLATLVAGGTVIGIILMLLFPAVGAVRGVAHAHQCDLNLKKIGNALQTYQAEHGAFPPAYVVGPDGRPWHSWRVMILPYLDEPGLFADYDFSQPWDSAHNQQLDQRTPAVFQCPADINVVPGETNYMAIVGDGTAFPGVESVGPSEIADDPSTTILVAEVPTFGVGWLEPRDLKVRSMQFQINGGFGQEIGSHHVGGAHVVMADGSVRMLQETLPTDYVSGMTTVNGGELIPERAFGH